MNNSRQIRQIYNPPYVFDSLLSKISQDGYKEAPQVDISILKEYVTPGVYIMIKEKFEKKKFGVIQQNDLERLLEKYDGVYIKYGEGECFYTKIDNRIYIEHCTYPSSSFGFRSVYFPDTVFEEYDDIIFMKIGLSDWLSKGLRRYIRKNYIESAQ